jgi:hypothetical protein
MPGGWPAQYDLHTGAESSAVEKLGVGGVFSRHHESSHESSWNDVESFLRRKPVKTG